MAQAVEEMTPKFDKKVAHQMRTFAADGKSAGIRVYMQDHCFFTDGGDYICTDDPKDPLLANLPEFLAEAVARGERIPRVGIKRDMIVKFPCPFCETPFESKETLIQHLSVAHQVREANVKQGASDAPKQGKHELRRASEPSALDAELQSQ